MSDYTDKAILKEQMIKYGFTAPDMTVTEFVEDIVPSAEPEIIRCKDCLIHGVCRFEQGLGLDGYCSQAERRTDG